MAMYCWVWISPRTEISHPPWVPVLMFDHSLCEHIFLYVKLKFQLKFVASTVPVIRPTHCIIHLTSLFFLAAVIRILQIIMPKHLLNLRWTASTSLPLFTDQLMYKVILLARHGLPLVSCFLNILKSSSCPSCPWKWLLLRFLMWGSLVWRFPEPLTCPS